MSYRKIENWDEIEKEVLDLLRAGLNISEACAVVGVDRTTLYKRMEKHPELSTKIERAKEYYRAWIKSEMYKVQGMLQKRGELRAVLKHLEWLAERKLRDEFASKQIVEHEGQMIVDVKQDIFEAMQKGISPENEDDKSTPDDKTKEHD